MRFSSRLPTPPIKHRYSTVSLGLPRHQHSLRLPLVTCSSPCPSFCCCCSQLGCPGSPVAGTARLCSPIWHCTQDRTRAPWLTGCRQLVLCPLQGSGVGLASFRRAGCSGSICFPTRLSESRPPTLTLSTQHKPAGTRMISQQKDARVLCTAWWLPVLGVRSGPGSALGRGPWAGLAHPETWQHLPVSTVRSASVTSGWLILAAASSCKASWGRTADFRLQVQCSFH